MEEEKRPLPGYKEFLERMYGVEISDPTPEERKQIQQRLELYRQSKQKQKESQAGPKDT